MEKSTVFEFATVLNRSHKSPNPSGQQHLFMLRGIQKLLVAWLIEGLKKVLEVNDADNVSRSTSHLSFSKRALEKPSSTSVR
ncbi:hypothetical protein L596_008460 [Steinernema carpocapsae]|uniref:Uncharacterized protein n=1 Tax=Steinernema carpocapsae TaxID=34508 RepID=A0A4U5PD27_STECR|nr:hypothetical protein L596_008460 [Steinernema carpocapsae]